MHTLTWCFLVTTVLNGGLLIFLNGKLLQIYTEIDALENRVIELEIDK